MSEEIKKHKHYLDLPVKYTEKEIAQLGRRLANGTNELQQIETQRKEANDGFKTKADNLDKVLNGIIEKIRMGSTMSTVECESDIDKNGKILKTIRKDTKEDVTGLGEPVLNLNAKKKKDEPKKEIETIEMVDTVEGRRIKYQVSDKKWEEVKFEHVKKDMVVRFVEPNGTQFADPKGNSIFKVVVDAIKVQDKDYFGVKVTPVIKEKKAKEKKEAKK